MRALIVGVIVLINFILQSTVFGYIAILDIVPNTALIFVVCYAILRGDVEGGIVGLASGLLRDIFFAPYFLGLNALLCMLAGYLCGKPFKHFFRENYVAPVILTAVSMLIYGILFYLVMFLPQGGTNFAGVFAYTVLPETVYTVIFALPLYHLVYRINFRLENYEKKRRSMF